MGRSQWDVEGHLSLSLVCLLRALPSHSYLHGSRVACSGEASHLQDDKRMTDTEGLEAQPYRSHSVSLSAQNTSFVLQTMPEITLALFSLYQHSLSCGDEVLTTTPGTFELRGESEASGSRWFF